MLGVRSKAACHPGWRAQERRLLALLPHTFYRMRYHGTRLTDTAEPFSCFQEKLEADDNDAVGNLVVSLEAGARVAVASTARSRTWREALRRHHRGLCSRGPLSCCV